MINKARDGLLVTQSPYTSLVNEGGGSDECMHGECMWDSVRVNECLSANKGKRHGK